MKRLSVVCCVVSLLCAYATATPVSYFVWDNLGGTFADVEKNMSNADDELMCWAAAAANVLEWTQWGKVAGMTRADEMFAYYRDHFTPNYGSAIFAWQWWFTGDYQMQGHAYQSQVDVPGGGFWPGVDFYSNYYYVTANHETMRALDYLLHQGWGTTVVVQSGWWAHQINLWGIDYDPETQAYFGIWVTDSEDAMEVQGTPDELKYYGVELIGGKWHLQDYKFDDCHIEQIAAIPHMSLVVPEPATLILMAAGASLVAARRKNARWPAQAIGRRCAQTLKTRRK